jgi:hypothetical protein
MHTRAFALALILTTQSLYCADVPVKRVILYKHGIGYFERDGLIPAGEEARLDFKADDMNDVLKSLTVGNIAGGRITGIRYDSNETLDQQLLKYPFKLGDQEFLSTFLDRIKGSRVALKIGDQSVTGSILSSRAIELDADNDKRLLREQVTLLLDSGDVANYDLGSAASIHLLDARLQEQLKQYLQTLAQAKSREKRSIYVDSSGSDVRNLRISYITPTAIWKSSYRLTLGTESPTLEGWAIVDNTTDEDWKDVKLSVVSGRPISFISLLDIPRYGQRQVAELPEDRAAGPVVYGGIIEGKTLVGTGSGSGYGPASRESITAKMYSTGGALSVAANAPSASLVAGENGQVPAAQQSVTLDAMKSTVQGATGGTVGELFEYHFAGPVTIKKNQSAMLPFLQDKITARKLLIYNDRDDEHPVNAAEVTNNTAKTLDGGPITVYEGGAYAGEALFETVKTGDKRLIGYAVDYGTRVTSAYESGEQTIREIHAKNGLLQVRYAQRQTRTYTMKNVDSKPKTLMLEQAAMDQYSLLSPSPAERTATAYRFEVKLPASGSEHLKIEQEQVTYNSTTVLSSTPDFLLTIVSNKQLTAAGRNQLQAIADLKRRIAADDAALDSTKAQMSDLNGDQSRLRQNIDSLNRVRGQENQVGKYSTQLAGNETELAKLRDQTRDLAQRKNIVANDLRGLIGRLDF